MSAPPAVVVPLVVVAVLAPVVAVAVVVAAVGVPAVVVPAVVVPAVVVVIAGALVNFGLMAVGGTGTGNRFFRKFCASEPAGIVSKKTTAKNTTQKPSCDRRFAQIIMTPGVERIG